MNQYLKNKCESCSILHNETQFFRKLSCILDHHAALLPDQLPVDQSRGPVPRGTPSHTLAHPHIILVVADVELSIRVFVNARPRFEALRPVASVDVTSLLDVKYAKPMPLACFPGACSMPGKSVEREKNVNRSSGPTQPLALACVYIAR